MLIQETRNLIHWKNWMEKEQNLWKHGLIKSEDEMQDRKEED